MTKKRVHQTYEVSLTATDTIQRVGRLFRHRAELFFQENEIDVSPEQWGVLLKAAENEGQPLGDLADPALRDYPNITRLTDALVKKGLLVRQPSPEDRRRALIVLTEQGRSLIDDALPKVVEEKEKYYIGLNQKDVERLRKLLAVIEDNLLKHYE